MIMIYANANAALLFHAGIILRFVEFVVGS